MQDWRQSEALLGPSKSLQPGRAWSIARPGSNPSGSSARMRVGIYPGGAQMLFVVHATDRKDAMNTRAKFYRAHRIHLDKAEDYKVGVVTAGTLVADDGEMPVGSVFVVDAKGRREVDEFTRSDPYHVNQVWERVQIHAYNKKRGSPM